MSGGGRVRPPAESAHHHPKGRIGTRDSQLTDAFIETDRYICWPGQALTYKIGQREIERLRAELTARDGGGFDIRTFHDAVLGHGSLPLATFARELPAWVIAPV